VNYAPNGVHTVTHATTIPAPLLAPVDSGLTLSVTHGSNDPLPTQECSIGTSRDHCLHQQFSLDLTPSDGWDGTIIAPSAGSVGWHDDQCLGITLADGVNLTLCHFGRFFVTDGDGVARGQCLGTARTNWIHINLDYGTAHQGGSSQPIPFTGAHSFEGHDLTPNEQRDQRFDSVFPVQSSNQRIGICR
jgi:hypothetical protein